MWVHVRSVFGFVSIRQVLNRVHLRLVFAFLSIRYVLGGTHVLGRNFVYTYTSCVCFVSLPHPKAYTSLY